MYCKFQYHTSHFFKLWIKPSSGMLVIMLTVLVCIKQGSFCLCAQPMSDDVTSQCDLSLAGRIHKTIPDKGIRHVGEVNTNSADDGPSSCGQRINIHDMDFVHSIHWLFVFVMTYLVWVGYVALFQGITPLISIVSIDDKACHGGQHIDNH